MLDRSAAGIGPAGKVIVALSPEQSEAGEMLLPAPCAEVPLTC